MGLSAHQLRLYLVTDPRLCSNYGVIETVRDALRAGVSFVQLRDKTASTPDRIRVARALKEVLSKTGVPLVINDDLEAALAADADGVHIGQDDVTPGEARARLGPSKIIGLSCETAAQVHAADPACVDYLGLGTVFSTPTKTDHKPAIEIAGLATLARAARLPRVAIGGLKQGDAVAVKATGCDGMAVVSAICGQPDPKEATRQLRRALDDAYGAAK